MPNVKRLALASGAVLAGIVGFSEPANAAIVACFVTSNSQPQCPGTNVNVLVNQETGPVVTAGDNDNTTNVTYSFDSTTEASLVQSASGQANVGSTDGVINQIGFNIIGGTASLITFNLLPVGPQSSGTDAQSVTVSYVGGSQVISGLRPNGQNFYGILATEGEQLTGLDFGPFTATAGNNVGIQALQQVQLNLNPVASAVPEAGTWAMMLVGFGAIGASMRRRRRFGIASLTQMA